ncbi:Lipin/Ned1/Smp2-domain-containing protein [Gongronella butleri]|nr:Lipin/Ned1/Smp2-domain-containing protein [Gongronella butleri]
MEYVGKLGTIFSSVQTFYNEINPATLSGAIDIIVVEQEDGELACSPFHVRFGKLSLLMPQEKKIEIMVNDQAVPYLMKVGEAGESFFVFETEHEVPEEFQTSPIVGAVTESKPDEEPPFLDLGESKDNKVHDATFAQDQFDDDEEDDDRQKAVMKVPVPPELQSPKMIIEEQMDKVVTTMDPYSSAQQHEEHATIPAQENAPADQGPVPQHDLFPLDDGSAMLERVIPEAITTTTIAKESFIVRPAQGDVYSKIMEVTHRAIEKRDDTRSKESDDATVPDAAQLDASATADAHKTSAQTSNVQKKQSKKVHDDSDPLDSHNQSIVLDIAGYKTSEDRADEDDTGETAQTASTPHSETMPPPMSPSILQDQPFEAGIESNSTWGWGKRRRSLPDDEESDLESRSPPPTSPRLEWRMVPGTVYRIELSLCGFSAFGTDEEENAAVFAQHQLNYDTLMHNPNLLNDKRLVFRYEHCYYSTAGHTGPLLTSLLLFKKPLQQHQFEKDRQNASNAITSEEDSQDVTTTTPGRTSMSTSDAAVTDQQPQGDGSSADSRESYLFGKGWRQWLSRSSVAASSSFGTPVTVATTPATTPAALEPKLNLGLDEDDVTTTYTTTTKTTTVGWTEEHEHHHHYDASKAGGGGEHATLPTHALDTSVPLSPSGMTIRKHYAKTLRLTSEQLKQLHLKKGANTITFSVSSAYQGTATCAAKIFFWDYDESVVISDIDGTITKSDALGHVFTMIGKDWTHLGVAKLYTDIVNNGYRIMYLTSRAIGQADYTRDYLKKVEQGHYQLPDGPVIMSPDRLFTSFHREIIMRKPEVFKMACLKDIQRLFGGRDPFYAGFGNRITDAISYRSVNVPSSRIFTIDTYGSVRLELLRSFTSSYIDLNDLVDQIFPPVVKDDEETDNSYNDWNFWKQPLPEIDLPELTPASPPPTSPKPIPIKPDLKPLPTQATVTTEKPTPSKSRLLRSLTSISASSTPSLSSSTAQQAHRRDSGSSSVLSSPRSTSPPPQEISTSAPSSNALDTGYLSSPPSSPPARPASSASASAAVPSSSSGELAPPPATGRTRVQSFTDTLRRPSLLLMGSAVAASSSSSVVSTVSSIQEEDLIDDLQASASLPPSPLHTALHLDGNGDTPPRSASLPVPSAETPTSTTSTTSTLMGGLRHTLSRTFAYGDTANTKKTAESSEKDDEPAAKPREKSEDRHNDLVDDDDDELNDDDFDIDDLENDMDDIPFI